MKRTLFSTVLMAFTLAVQAQTLLPYQDASLSPSKRADDLLQRLTLSEKVGLMMDQSQPVTRLGIKPYQWWNEALHGVARNGVATMFPQAIGLAATFDDALVQECFDIASTEARVKNRLAREESGNNIMRYQGLTFWTPNVNIFRDPRWGRGQETYGEDPYLTSRMGVAVVKGLQGPDGNKTHACAKHYAVHSGPEWNRHVFNADNVNPRDLWETYLPAFKALVTEAHVKEVMCAYNRYENEPCCGSSRLLTQILRNEWGFDGLVTSDCWAINDFYTPGAHFTEPDAKHADAKAVWSGTDLECGGSYVELPAAVNEGLITEDRIDQSVFRLLKARFELGEMDDKTPYDSIPASVIASAGHKAKSLQAAREGIVLLKNDPSADGKKGPLLPLNPRQKIAVVGPNADNAVMLWGNYNGTPDSTISILDGISKYVKPNKLIYSEGCGLAQVTSYSSWMNRGMSEAENGWVANYYNTTDFSGPIVAYGRYTTAMQLYTYGGTAFKAGVNIQDFSATFKTTLKLTKSSKVEFDIKAACKKIQLLVNGEVVLEAEGQLGKYDGSTEPAYVLDAQAGKSYDLEVRYVAGKDINALMMDMGHNASFDDDALLRQLRPADVVVFVGGIAPSLEGEEMPIQIEGFKGGDRTDIQLPRVQRELIAKIRKSGKRIVFINCSGSAMGMVPEAENCDAMLQVFYPGQMGGQAVAETLFGDNNPSGRLPLTFYKDTLQMPGFEDYAMKGRTYRYMTEKPLFCFGHGLSYTTFAYGEAQLVPAKMQSNGTMTKEKLIIPVTNTGTRDGAEVVQLYVQRPGDQEGPVKTLRGFKRVNIAKGETVNVEFDIDNETFSWFDTCTDRMMAQSGQYNLLYGGTSADEGLKVLQVVRP
ncbi:MAG: glycoside hydrolase family 3 C-terminal domain-containing protein [Bacteroidales bacterium]|nr:glycoside hydrolase family 3 C-terminal domain-containing protein [Bacteroidales bacterium]